MFWSVYCRSTQVERKCWREEWILVEACDGVSQLEEDSEVSRYLPGLGFLLRTAAFQKLKTIWVLGDLD